MGENIKYLKIACRAIELKVVTNLVSSKYSKNNSQCF